MNSLIKKMFIFLSVMAVVALAGWFGRKAYKNATERRAIAEANHYLEQKDPRNAALCLQRALQINPISVPAYKLMADILEGADSSNALGWRMHAAQFEPNNMTNRLLWAETAIKLHDFKSADEALGGLDEKSKNGAMYHKLCGAMAWSQGKSDEAQKHYHEALRLEPGNETISLNIQTIALASTNTQTVASARTAMEALSTNATVRPIALHYLLADATTHKSFERAVYFSSEIVREPSATISDKIEHLQLLHRTGSTNFAPWLASLKSEASKSPGCAFALGQWMGLIEGPTNTLRWLGTLPSAMQTNQPVPLIAADCYVAMKDWKGLTGLLEKQDWGDANCYRLTLLSFGQRELNENTASQSSWHKALRLAGHHSDRLARLAQATAEHGWDTENTEVLREAAAEFPKEKWAVENLAGKYYASGNTRELSELISKTYAADSSNARLKNNLANLSMLRKADLEEAFRLAREAYDSSPENPFFTSTYAYSLLLQNKPGEAAKIVDSLKPESLKNPSVAAYYGVVEAQSGHKDLAKAPLERAAAAKLLPEENAMVKVALASL
ncbi:MAG TPA: hypothetical protein VH413_09870 [Verrucomicrobiae bacterium]|jgi:predicted Zn-dependent protease|nr:hypothetical protein [Verrucomicrobiae bacterium]